MTVFKLLSKRMKTARVDLPPLELSVKFRTQACHALRDCVGDGFGQYTGPNPVWKAVRGSDHPRTRRTQTQ